MKKAIFVASIESRLATGILHQRPEGEADSSPLCTRSATYLLKYLFALYELIGNIKY